MKKSYTLIALFLVCLLIAISAVYSITASESRAVNTAKVQTAQVNRTVLMNSMNKSVTIEGFYFNDSIPMIVQDLKLVQVDDPIPPDKYIPVTGTVPSSVKLGDKIKVTGKVQKPTERNLLGESLSIQIEGSGVSVLQKTPVLQEKLDITASLEPIQPVQTLYQKYAILIGGGKNYANDYVRYWNDITRTYLILKDKGYKPENIRVCYSNGVPRSSSMPVNYPANTSGISAAFSYIGAKAKENDTVFIMVSGQNSPPGDVATTTAYWTWQNVPVTPNQFAYQVNKITKYKQMYIFIHPSYSGGFIPYLKKDDRVIITSAAANRSAYAHPSYYYGNFNYWYLSALTGHVLLGGSAVNADANSNGKVSLTEAYNFTLPRTGLAPITYQVPQFEDNGVLPSHFGTMPTGGDGLIGKDSYW